MLYSLIFSLSLLLYGGVQTLRQRRDRRRAQAAMRAGDYQAAWHHWERLARRWGDGGACYQLGWLSWQLEEYALARAYFEAATLGRHADAWNALGWLHQQGLGGARDYYQAQRAYQEGARLGSAAAAFNLAVLCEQGRGRAQDLQAARRYYEWAARHGLTEALLNLGSWHARRRDYGTARHYYQRAAARGDRHGQYYLGLFAFYGLGGPRQRSLARRQWQTAAAQNHYEAAWALGRYYRRLVERGGRSFTPGALHFLKQAAAAGRVGAQRELGLFYWQQPASGGERQRRARACHWLSQAAAAADREALWALGRLAGESGNWPSACAYYQQAAALGQRLAQRELADCYRQGRGVPEDEELADYWLLQAAQRGEVYSQRDWAQLCLEQDDLVQARFWLELALQDNPARLAADFDALEAAEREQHQPGPPATPALPLGGAGSDIEQNFARACDWYQRRAEWS